MLVKYSGQLTFFLLVPSFSPSADGFLPSLALLSHIMPCPSEQCLGVLQRNSLVPLVLLECPFTGS